MRKITHLVALCALLLLVLSGCSRKDGDKPGGGNGFRGSILYEFAGTVYQMDMKTATRTVYFSYNTYSFLGWDLSRDLTLGLTSERQPGNYVSTTFKLLNAANREIVKQFEYQAPNGNGQRYTGELSPDNSLILIQPDLNNGIVLLNTDGEIKYHLKMINGEAITLGDQVEWLPDNSLLLTFQDKYILKTSPPYTQLTLVKEMNYEKWGNLTVSNDGRRVSMYVGNHIHLMDIDGGELLQVTTSRTAENRAVFSPDGAHLLVGSKYVHAPLSGSVWELKIIPNDGKLYDLDNDEAVVPVKPVNDVINASVSGRVLWIP